MPRIASAFQLLVAPGPHAPFTRRQKFRARRLQQLRTLVPAAAERGRDLRQRPGDDEMPVLALEVRLRVEAVVRGDDRVLLGREQRRDLARRPDVELALLVLGVGV
jgi:hypothetical protein